MTTYVICNRCGKPKLPVYSDGTEAPTSGYCQCQNETGWGEALLRQPIMDWRDGELARLRAELEKARAELATLDISYKEAIHSIGVDRHNAERWQSECLNAREEARRLQALIERRRIEANDTRVNAAGWEERALRAERERDEAVGRLNKAVIDIAHGATEAVKWEKRAREAERKLSVSETLRAAASQSGNEVAKSTLDYYAMEKRKARTYEKLAATYAAIASRQRRTIRALVVAGRGMYYAIVRALVGWGVPPSDKLTKQATMRIKYGIMRTREDGKE